MLIQFIIDNFLSFGSRQEFSMFAGKTRAHQDRVVQGTGKNILKFAALFGANASGKSNLTRAMAFMDKTVEEGKLPEGSSLSYCRSNEKNKERATYFEVIIVLEDVYYSYGFEVLLAQGLFISEWLIQMSEAGKEHPIFTRDLRTGMTDIAWKLPHLSKDRLKLYAQDLRNDQTTLLLSAMNSNKKQLYEDFPDLSLLSQVYRWFFTIFNASAPHEPLTSGSRFLIETKLQEIAALLSDYDTNIISIEKSEVLPMDLSRRMNQQVNRARELLQKEFVNEDESAKEMTVLMRDATNFLCVTKLKDTEEIAIKKIFFRHSDGQDYSIGEESDGTIRIMDLAEILLSTEPKVFVIDELDRCLHPQLTYRFVKNVLSHIAKHSMQVIVTTHESRLLDLDLLRRDEIWFVEKKKSESLLFSLEEFNERNDRKIDKAYLDGRYGGVPIFETVFPNEVMA